jgi:NAD-dependent dihydropyrimidine dehydrogenase PreA subunit
MGLFIKLEIDQGRCLGLAECGKCLGVCPVKIFEENGDEPQSLEANEDECTLCGLCLDVCQPDAITVVKLYDEP